MKNILIIGYGNFGKLLADKLSTKHKVYIFNKKKIKQIKIEFGGQKKNIKIFSVQEKINFDVIIFAVPVQFLEKSVQEWKDKISPCSLILDVSSVKIFPLKILKKNFPQNQIIGTHPLFGPESLRKEVKDLKVVISNISAQSKNLNKIKKNIQNLNFKVLEMTPRGHDQKMAKIQTTSHLLGYALREMNLTEEKKFRTLAYRKMFDLYQNVLNDSEELFETIQKYNPYAQKEREKFLKILQKINKRY